MVTDGAGNGVRIPFRVSALRVALMYEVEDMVIDQLDKLMGVKAEVQVPWPFLV